jgi:hypothetical protein
MTYHGMGQAAPPPALPAGPITSVTAPSTDVATTPVDILAKHRGFVAVPTVDLRDYVQAQIVTMGIGFIVGVTVGAALGNVVKGKAAITANPSRRRSRRRSHRRRGRRVQRNASELHETASPLTYNHGYQVKRLQIVDLDAPPTTEMYFVTKKVGAFGKKKTTMPGADPGVVAWLDYHLYTTKTQNDSVYIDFIRVRSDMQKRGLMKQLVDKIFAMYPDADVDFGKMMHDSVVRLYEKKRSERGRVYGKVWNNPGAARDVEKAVELMRLYMGSERKISIRDQQKLYTRVQKAVSAVERRTGVTNAWDQVEVEARKRGSITPRPGQHY